LCDRIKARERTSLPHRADDPQLGITVRSSDVSATFRAVLGFVGGIGVAVLVLAMGLNSVHEGDNPIVGLCLVVALLSPVAGPLLAVRLGRRRPSGG